MPYYQFSNNPSVDLHATGNSSPYYRFTNNPRAKEGKWPEVSYDLYKNTSPNKSACELSDVIFIHSKKKPKQPKPKQPNQQQPKPKQPNQHQPKPKQPNQQQPKPKQPNQQQPKPKTITTTQSTNQSTTKTQHRFHSNLIDLINMALSIKTTLPYQIINKKKFSVSLPAPPLPPSSQFANSSVKASSYPASSFMVDYSA